MIAEQLVKINIEMTRHSPTKKHGLLHVGNVSMCKVHKFFTIPRLNSRQHEKPTRTPSYTTKGKNTNVNELKKSVIHLAKRSV